MPNKLSRPYQPLLFRILHGLTALFVIAAILTAFWTYNTYDGRWGTLLLPYFPEIEGIHGTFGLSALLLFPAFVIYAFDRGQQRLLQPNSLAKLSQIGQPIWWYTLHRLANTLAILALTFALFSGKMMDSSWLPKGELDHFWYYTHLVSWVVVVSSIALHLLMSTKVGGAPLLLSVLHWQFHKHDSPAQWKTHLLAWWRNFQLSAVANWLRPISTLKILEVLVLLTIATAWIVSLFKEMG
jgi:hypothetical protein